MNANASANAEENAKASAAVRTASVLKAETPHANASASTKANAAVQNANVLKAKAIRANAKRVNAAAKKRKEVAASLENVHVLTRHKDNALHA